ncbi:MAG: DUF1761 domain-containing protein [Bacteroidetes bacterium]|nr:DUF1761 domain-containing protein [Bacteroidota bacterium]MCH8234153.1 DUF1761 domain-containing protein [Bacteroidota bacterium]
MKSINHAAVWVCVILLTGLGFLWYETLFGELWMEMSGLSLADIEANPPGAGVWITNFIATVVPLYVLAWLLHNMNVESGMGGAGIGLLISFSFVFLTIMTGNMFAMKPYALSWITGGYGMVAMTLSGFILGVWRKKGATT